MNNVRLPFLFLKSLLSLQKIQTFKIYDISYTKPATEEMKNEVSWTGMPVFPWLFLHIPLCFQRGIPEEPFADRFDRVALKVH